MDADETPPFWLSPHPFREPPPLPPPADDEPAQPSPVEGR